MQAVARNQDTMPLPKKIVSACMSFILALMTTPIGTNAQTSSQAPAQDASTQAAPEEYAPLTADELDALVAPIALYPDALVAQVLGAATFPYEIVDAGFWMKDNSTLTGEALAKAVDQQSWDPAVKALTQFPSVLENLAKNLAWTSSLGEASATQQADVMAAIQRMRAKAQAAGTLKSSPQIKVVQEAPQTIVIQPANPQIVYVPTYNPTVIYGAPVVVPGYSSADVAAVALLSFGVGIAVGAAVYGGCCGWGWSYWGTNWHSHTVIYNRNVYVGNSYWRGGYYGGYRPGYPGYRPPPPGYRPGYPGYRPPPPGYRPPPNGNRPGYPGYGRPPATTLPAPGTGNPNRPGTNPPTTRPSPGTPTTRPTNPPGTRPGGGAPSTQPVTRPGTTPSTRPSTQESRGYRAPTGNVPAAQPSRPNAISGSAGGRAQSARGNQSMGGGGNRGGGSRR
jgi:Protein of unknown function (DUF3300)